MANTINSFTPVTTLDGFGNILLSGLQQIQFINAVLTVTGNTLEVDVGGGGGNLTVDTFNPVNNIQFVGASVVDDGGGQVTVTISPPSVTGINHTSAYYNSVGDISSDARNVNFVGADGIVLGSSNVPITNGSGFFVGNAIGMSDIDLDLISKVVGNISNMFFDNTAVLNLCSLNTYSLDMSGSFISSASINGGGNFPNTIFSTTASVSYILIGGLGSATVSNFNMANCFINIIGDVLNGVSENSFVSIGSQTGDIGNVTINKSFVSLDSTLDNPDTFLTVEKSYLNTSGLVLANNSSYSIGNAMINGNLTLSGDGLSVSGIVSGLNSISISTGSPTNIQGLSLSYKGVTNISSNFAASLIVYNLGTNTHSGGSNSTGHFAFGDALLIESAASEDSLKMSLGANNIIQNTLSNGQIQLGFFIQNTLSSPVPFFMKIGKGVRDGTIDFYGDSLITDGSSVFLPKVGLKPNTLNAALSFDIDGTTDRSFINIGNAGITVEDIVSTNVLAGQIVVFRQAVFGSTTFQHNTDIILSGSVDKVLTLNSTLTLIYSGTAWVEIASSIV